MPVSPARRTVQEYEGNADMDMPRLSERPAEPTTFVAEQGEPIKLDVYLQDKSAVVHACILDKDGKRLKHARGVGGVHVEFNSPPAAGYYQVRVGLEVTGQNKKTPYWVKLDYQGSKTRPTAYP